MAHFASASASFQMGCLQGEIPFGGAVGIVDQHQVRIVFQALGLSLHSLPILLDKFGEDELQQARTKGQPSEEVPGSDYVNAAVVAGDWRDRSEAGKPILARANGLNAKVGKNKIDRRRD